MLIDISGRINITLETKEDLYKYRKLIESHPEADVDRYWLNIMSSVGKSCDVRPIK